MQNIDFYQIKTTVITASTGSFLGKRYLKRYLPLSSNFIYMPGLNLPRQNVKVLRNVSWKQGRSIGFRNSCGSSRFYHPVPHANNWSLGGELSLYHLHLHLRHIMNINHIEYGSEYVRKIPPKSNTPAVQRSSHRPRRRRYKIPCLFPYVGYKLLSLQIWYFTTMETCIKHIGSYKTTLPLPILPLSTRGPFFLIPFPSSASCKRPKLWSWTGACLPNISATPEDLKVQKSPTEQPPFFQRKTAFGSCFPCA